MKTKAGLDRIECMIEMLEHYPERNYCIEWALIKYIKIRNKYIDELVDNKPKKYGASMKELARAFSDISEALNAQKSIKNF